MSSVLGSHCGICVNVKLDYCTAKTTEATVPFLSLDNKPVQPKYLLLNVKDAWLPRAEKKNSKRKSPENRELSPDDSGELRALGTLPLYLVAKINPTSASPPGPTHTGRDF